MYTYWIYSRNGSIERLPKKKKRILLSEHPVKKNSEIEHMIPNDKHDKSLQNNALSFIKKNVS